MRKPSASGVDRRTFLRGIGLGLAGSSLGACVVHDRDADPYALPKPAVPGSEKVLPLEEKTVVTACGQCPAGCGIRVRVVGGHAVEITGDEDNPINRGGIGPRGRGALQVLYDPDRITQPLRRQGERGSGSWEPIEWEAAIEQLVDRLAGLRERGEPHRLGLVSGNQRGLLLELFRRFGRAYGTPNVFDGLSRKHAAIAQATWLTQGVRDIPTFDWPRTRYVLSLGAGILESSCQMVYFTRAAARLRRGRDGSRAKVVQVEPSPSKTAQQADEWISIRPGTHAAFALGLAHVLVRDGLHDEDFVRDLGFGFSSWTDDAGTEHLGFADLLLRDYAPETVARTCGVPARILERLAHEMADERPAVVAVDERATMASNGLHVALAAQALNALLGSLDRPGGVLTARPAPVGNWGPVEPDAVAQAGLAQPRVDGVGTRRHPLGQSSLEALPDALLARHPYELDTLLLHYSNPLHSGMSPERWRRALSSVPFIVSFSPFMDETVTEMADLVLPDHSFLERWEDAAPAPSVGHPVFGVRQPVVEPLHDTRASGDVLLELARGLGGVVEEALDWKDFQAVVFAAFKELHETQRGTIVEKKFRNFGRELMRAGWWADADYPLERWAEILKTPSGRFEFFSLSMHQALEDFAAASGSDVGRVLTDWGRPADLDLACLPHHVEIAWAGEESALPLVLEPFTPGTHAEGGGANQPILQELVTERGQRPWSTTASIAVETGRRLGLETGDEAELTSPAGTVRLRVALDPDVRPEVVRVPRGGGHRAFGRWASGWGANVQELLVPAFEPFGGCPAHLGTRVSLRRIG